MGSINDTTADAPRDAPGSSGQPQQPQPRLYSLSALLPEFRADAEAAHQARVSGTPRGPITGLKSLDREIGGAFAPGPHILHGNTGTGKTALALQIASDCKFPALYVTCEMGPVELLRRMIARETNTLLGRLKSGELAPSLAESLARQAIEVNLHLHLLDATTAPASPQFIYDNAINVKGDAPHLLIVVDSLHSWAEGIYSDAPEYEALNGSLAKLRELAHRLSCPVLIISERNRGSIKGGGVNAGAGTRKIEYGAETVIDLDRKEDAREDGGGKMDVVLKLVKNRHGAPGKPIALKFNGALQAFGEG